MGSITFNSLDGSSRAHSHIFGEIRELKALAKEDDDVMLSLSEGFFADYLWIEGKDRKAFAKRIRSVLATAPEGEWTRRGLRDRSDPESKRFAEICEERGIRVPGLLSLAEHLEANEEYPVVITHSVSADFPTTDYADKNWLKAAKKAHGEDYLYHFDGLPIEEQWALTLPRLMKEEAVLQWKKPLSEIAEYVRNDRMKNGLWRSPTPTSVAEQEILAAKSWDQMKPVLETFYERLKPKADELIGDQPAYVICNSLDSMALAEEFAKSQGERLPGITHVYMQVLKMSSDWSEFKVFDHNKWVEESTTDTPLVFLPLSLIAISEEIIQLIELLTDKVKPSKVIVLAALSNPPQVRLIEDHFAAHPLDVSIHALESVNDSLLHARHHLSEMTRASSIIQPPASKWFWRRMIETMKKEEKAEKREAMASAMDD